MVPPDIFYDRKDLFIGSLIALILGPFAAAALWSWLGHFLLSGSLVSPLVILGVISCFYVIFRAALDVASDLAEWRNGMRFRMPLRSDPPEASDPRNRYVIRWLTAEAIVFGGGAIMLLAFLQFNTRFFTSRSFDLTTCGAVAIAIGALTMYDRNLVLVYPFHFRNWIGLRRAT